MYRNLYIDIVHISIVDGPQTLCCSSLRQH